MSIEMRVREMLSGIEEAKAVFRKEKKRAPRTVKELELFLRAKADASPPEGRKTLKSLDWLGM